jgi:acetyltransferase-like isoleucine patch superfamily enzyme
MARRLARRFASRRSRRNIHSTGRAVLTIDGTVDGNFYLGVVHGLWTDAPTFVSVGQGAVLRTDGRVDLYGDNTIRVEPGAILSVGDETRINIRTSINVKQQVTIGRRCLISQDVHIRDNDGHKLDGVEGVAPVSIHDHVWIGYRSTILKGVTIGTGAVVAACSVVVRDVPAHAVVAGNPAQVLKAGIEWGE